MVFKNRLQVLAVSAAALFGTVAMAAPASAATYGNYTYHCAQTTNATYNGYGYWYVIRPWVRQTPVRVAPTTAKPAPAPAPAPTPAPAPAPTPAPTAAKPVAPAPQTQANGSASAGLTAEEQQMLDLVNQERTNAGIAPLKADPQLTKIARLKSQDMINGNYFSHQSPTYGSPFDMMKTYGITYRTAGENIAGNQSVAAAHTALMNSAGHRANILNSQFNYVGIGIVHGGQYGVMFTQDFVGR
ncbi:MAG: hypothetical protein JWN15_1997 [Firmicutes bacterium]|nr:hypothetical protein [Bacillota bacterium]